MAVPLRLPLLAVLLLAGLMPSGRQAVAAEPDSLATGSVTYLTRTSAYVDVGTLQGIVVGHRLEVVDGDSLVAVLEATHVARTRASCRIVEAGGDPTVGNLVRFVPDPAVLSGTRVAESALATLRSERRRRSRVFHPLREWGLKGRVGIRYLTVMDHALSEAGFSQPALDLRLAGVDVGGSPWDFEVDVRARRTYTTRDGDSESDGRTRVYRLGASWQGSDSPWRLSLGRQVSSNLSVVSIFDGFLAEFQGEQWGIGAFAGAQPRAGDLVGTTDILEGGAYASWRSAPGDLRRWTMTLGAITSHEDGNLNREYLFLRGRWNNRKLFAYFTQELDINRGWKQDQGEAAVSPTSSYLNLRYQWTELLAVQGGVDNRRNIRLYRDQVTPETEFDDSYRQGYWGGVSLGPARGLRASVNLRSSTGSRNGTSNSGTLTLRADRRPWMPVDLSSRHTRYEGPLSRGWLHSLSAGTPWGARRRVEVHAGVRDEERDPAFGSDTRTTWVGTDLDLGLGRWVYLLISAEATRSDLEDNDQVYSSLTYRF